MLPRVTHGRKSRSKRQMLKHLYIKNFALIKELDIDLNSGFSVITGETGAGKSIILGAIGLALGQKADSKSIMPGEDKCIIEATFSIEEYNLQPLFDENELDYDPKECIIRRELNQSGKSRSYVNDSPTSVAFLKEIGYHLIDIHSQHQNLLIAKEDYQLNLLDTVAQDNDLLQQYKSCYKDLRQAESTLAEMKEEIEKAKAEQEFLEYQLEQLEELNPQEDEDEELKSEQNELNHAEDIKSALYQADGIFSNESEQGGILEQTRRLSNVLQGLSRIYPNVEDYAERIESVLIEMKDISSDIYDLAENVEYNPQRLEEVTSRLDTLYTLEQKHNVDSSNELIDIMNDIREKLDGISDGDDRIKELEDKIKAQQAEANKIAKALKAERKKAAKLVEEFVCKTLTQMDMPNNKFQIDVEDTISLTSNGADKATFLFSANKNAPLRQISQVASGGEIARVMLALKAMTSQMVNLPTIIFDEIDTGVSGKVADSMADIMSTMGQGSHKQVIAITHLPQIAAKGDSHYWVYKQDDEEQTYSHIKQLSKDERINEIAHMLSGSEITKAAMENAKQLLKG